LYEKKLPKRLFHARYKNINSLKENGSRLKRFPLTNELRLKKNMSQSHNQRDSEHVKLLVRQTSIRTGPLFFVCVAIGYQEIFFYFFL